MNEIDKKIISEIEFRSGYKIDDFCTRFNDGAHDTVQCLYDVYEEYSRYMTHEYMCGFLLLDKPMVVFFTKNKFKNDFIRLKKKTFELVKKAESFIENKKRWQDQQQK